MARTTTARHARQATATTRRNRYVAMAARVARHQPPATTLTRKPEPATTPVTTPVEPVEPVTTPVEPVTTPEPVGASPEHQTTVTGAGEQWHASCSCGEWRTSNPYKRESGAKGAATKHRNTAEAARLG